MLSGAGKSVIATDVLWSDPSNQPGLMENAARGVGLLFGPDITQVSHRLTLHCHLGEPTGSCTAS